MRLVLLVVASATLGASCVAYNDPCTPLVDDPAARVAFIAKGTEVWIDRPNARHANNAIGQAAADAFAWVFQDTDDTVNFAIVNGGAIRAEGLCITRNILKEGPLSNGVLHDVLLFENQVLSVDLSEQEVYDAFEHSVERLYAQGNAIASPSGAFLQPSSAVAMEVDCSKAPLARITSLKIGGVAVQRPPRPFPQVKYRAAMVSFLLGGSDGYTMFAGKGDDAARNPKQAQRFGGIDSNITTAYLQQSPFNQTVEQGLKVEPRVKLTNCAATVRPSN